MRRIVATAAIVALTGPAPSRAASPYLPLDLAPEIESRIERVMIYADRPVLTRPIAAAAVLDALPVACARDRVLCEQVREDLEHYTGRTGLSHARIAVGATSGTATTLPNRHGMRSDSVYELSVGGFWQPSDGVVLSAGGHAYDGDSTPTGTMLSLGFRYLQLDAGYREHWLSPMREQSTLIGTQAETMPSLTISNYAPLTRLNIRYELFLAEMSHSDRIRFGDGFTSGHPRLAGLHFSIAPFPGWSIGINRLMQFGGGERGGTSFRDVIDAFFDPAGNDNIGGMLSPDEEFGNQVASITSTILIPGPRPFSVYLEYAGEDTSTLSNRRLGNTSLAAGVFLPGVLGQTDLTLEVAEWQNAWYVHSIYTDGLRNEGNVLGHWAGDWRVQNDAVGGSSFTVEIARPLRNGWIEARYRTLRNEAYSPTSYERGHLLDLLYSRRVRERAFGFELNVGQDVFGNSFSRFAGFIRF